VIIVPASLFEARRVGRLYKGLGNSRTGMRAEENLRVPSQFTRSYGYLTLLSGKANHITEP
jgi:hypothetical protein